MPGEYRIGIPGSYQAENAAVALEVLDLINDTRIGPATEAGLRKAHLNARMQKVDGLPMVIDGTHTVSGARFLAKDIGNIYGKVVTVLGMLNDKDSEGIVEALAGVSDRFIITSPDSERALPADKLMNIAEGTGIPAEVSPSVPEAVGRALVISDGRTILVTGSFRMAEGAFRWLRTRSA